MRPRKTSINLNERKTRTARTVGASGAVGPGADGAYGTCAASKSEIDNLKIKAIPRRSRGMDGGLQEEKSR
jgi:hypothetical protein